jgi:hypothetical protein
MAALKCLGGASLPAEHVAFTDVAALNGLPLESFTALLAVAQRAVAREPVRAPFVAVARGATSCGGRAQQGRQLQPRPPRARVCAELMLPIEFSQSHRALPPYAPLFPHPQTLDLLAAAEGVCAAGGPAAKAKVVKAGLRTLMFILQGAAKHGVTPAALRDDLAALGLDAARAGGAGAAWEAGGGALIQVATDRAVEGAGGSLVDAEWRFGVSVSTDELGRVGSTFLQVKLATVGGRGGEGGSGSGGQQLATHHMELTISQFYDLLSALEKAKSYVEFLGASA